MRGRRVHRRLAAAVRSAKVSRRGPAAPAARGRPFGSGQSSTMNTGSARLDIQGGTRPACTRLHCDELDAGHPGRAEAKRGGDDCDAGDEVAAAHLFLDDFLASAPRKKVRDRPNSPRRWYAPVVDRRQHRRPLALGWYGSRMSAKPGTATDPRTGPWRVQSLAWHKGTGSVYVIPAASGPKERGALGARVYVTHPDGQCDAARAMLATVAAQAPPPRC